MTTARRNCSLLKAIADAFVLSVLQMCKQNSALAYTWMRYLPRAKDHNWDPFWKDLVDDIIRRLKTERVLRSRQKLLLGRVSDLHTRADVDNDEHGNPLFDDMDPELYLSDRYTVADIEILTELGLSGLSFASNLATVRKDLSMPTTGLWCSKWKGSRMDDNWHRRAATLLRLPYKHDWAYKEEVKKLEVVRLSDGSWVSTSSELVYYGTIGDIPVPKDLYLRLVHPDAARLKERRLLFDSLGVMSLQGKTVRDLIVSHYAFHFYKFITLDASLEHLRFLYRIHESLDPDERVYGGSLAICDIRGSMVKPSASDLYIQDNEPFGAMNLLGLFGASKVGLSFVNSEYFKDPPRQPQGMDLTWSEWPVEGCLVSTFTSGPLRHQLENMSVTCTNNKMIPLYKSFLPLNELKNVYQRFSEGENDFPFLQLPPDEGDSLAQWAFLSKELGVGSKDDLAFRIQILQCIRESGKPPSTDERATKLAKLYLYIEASCMESQNRASESESAR